LLYPLAYFIFVLIIAGIFPAIKYPYPFIDYNVLSISELIQNVVTYSIGFFVLGWAIVGVDRLLPKNPIIFWFNR
jgi:cytochrome b subunit of formate dehydrogenase